MNLGTFRGEKGHWMRQGRAQLADNPESVLAAGPGGLSTNLKLTDVPFEYICQENNLVEETNDGADGSVRRTRLITP